MRMTQVGVVCGLLSAALAGCGPDGVGGVPLTDHQRGYNQGVAEVREVRAKGGVVENLGAEVAVAMGMFPTLKDKSDDWNAGYRQGIKAEMAK